MRLTKNMETVLEQGTELIGFYRKHPIIAANELLSVDFAPIQRIMFQDMWFKNFVIGICSRGAGKTYMLGTLSVLSCLLYPGYRAGLIGPVFRQSFPIISDTYDTFWTSSGLKSTVEELYNSVVPDITQIQSLKNRNTILSKWKNDERACVSIDVTKGFKLYGSSDHLVMILNNKFDIDFKELQDIKSEYIVIKHGFNYFGNNNSMPKFDEFKHDWRTKDCITPTELTSDLSYWMGLLVGDGCVSVSKTERKQCVDFVSEDQDLLNSFENYLKEYFLLDKEEKIYRNNRKNNIWKIQYFCKKLVQYLLKCGFTKTTALDQKIPDVLKKASRENLIAFLQGLYDTDGGVYIQRAKGCTINFVTSSKQLAIEVQAVLLNLGIISSLDIGSKACIRQLPEGNKFSKCAKAYKIRITGQTYLKKFNEIVGFRSVRKNKMLIDYLNSHSKNEESIGNTIGLPQEIVNNNLKKALKYAEDGIYFVKAKNKDYFFADTFDIEVENEFCYWANGFINHNSKMIFSEVEKLYSKSPILREACEKRPTRGADTCFLKFKSVGGKNGSFIEAMPLGDGGKIRGSRFYLVCADELAQIPNQILDMVIRPMGATVLEPMENVRRIERKKQLISQGLASESDFEEESSVNKMIMTSSGYYKFNHMWKRMRDYWQQMDIYGEKSQYSVFQIPYQLLPEGFLDKNNIEEAKRIMSDIEFKMEYCATMISDSEGFFLASLLEACSVNSGFSVKISGDKDKRYMMGVDPNQGGNASCGVVLIEMGDVNKIINVLELKKMTTQELTSTIQSLCEHFNIERIYMDKGGGGNAIKDLLEEGYNGRTPIIDRTNEEHKHLSGRHILEVVNFNPRWIEDANFATLALLQDKKLKFPEPTTSTDDVYAHIYNNVSILKSQMLNIIVTPTSNNSLHFDTPKKGQNKDLYSALILSAYGVSLFTRELEEPTDPILYDSGGFLRPHNPGAQWNAIIKTTTGDRMINRGQLDMAVLKKPLK